MAMTKLRTMALAALGLVVSASLVFASATDDHSNGGTTYSSSSPLGATSGGTGKTTLTTSAILYGSSSNTYGEIAPCASGVLIYSAGSVPSCATDLPTAATIGGAYSYRAGGTDVALLDGGLNASLTASNGGIFYSTSSAGAILAGTSTAGRPALSGATAAPTWANSVWTSPSDGRWVATNLAGTAVAQVFLGPVAGANMPWIDPATDPYSGKASFAFNDTTSSNSASFTGSGTSTNGTTAMIFAGSLSAANANYGLLLENGSTSFASAGAYYCWTNSTTRARGASVPFNTCLTQASTSAGDLQIYDNTAGALYGNFGKLLEKTTAGVDFNSGTKQTLVTGPTGKTTVVDHLIIRNASTSLTTASCGFGQDANASDWAATATHTGLTGSTQYQKITGPTTVGVVAAAAATFGVKCTILQGGAATVTIDVFYYVF